MVRVILDVVIPVLGGRKPRNKAVGDPVLMTIPEGLALFAIVIVPWAVLMGATLGFALFLDPRHRRG